MIYWIVASRVFLCLRSSDPSPGMCPEGHCPRHHQRWAEGGLWKELWANQRNACKERLASHPMTSVWLDKTAVSNMFINTFALSSNIISWFKGPYLLLNLVLVLLVTWMCLFLWNLFKICALTAPLSCVFPMYLVLCFWYAYSLFWTSLLSPSHYHKGQDGNVAVINPPKPNRKLSEALHTHLVIFILHPFFFFT